MVEDLRLCFVGDSFVAGVGDPRRLGWAGRLAAAASPQIPLTVYNLGIRGQTAPEIEARLIAECAPRLPEWVTAGVVLSFGANDTAWAGGEPRVAPAASASALTRMLDAVAARGWAALMVGPPPVAEDAHNARIGDLDAEYARRCAAAAVPYVPVLAALSADEVWMREVREGDGAHPGAAGYEAMAALVAPAWETWFGGLAR
ncbi:G-D-S-L family lipolytic protein [Nocardia higoensis]|uniref:G-D-S-L family lipolytic protein n=1 Tax=Nocardia higoensis TaxID=228599 RepID=A0ABS0DDZ0_9NOCA|nr:GDSL-type esterase/lipase family protein [Nocardia higoensis]MBF6356682.1 G-D-S-L family lipolytic protein [Nocardia higoensis]